MVAVTRASRAVANRDPGTLASNGPESFETRSTGNGTGSSETRSHRRSVSFSSTNWTGKSIKLVSVGFETTELTLEGIYMELRNTPAKRGDKRPDLSAEVVSCFSLFYMLCRGYSNHKSLTALIFPAFFSD